MRIGLIDIYLYDNEEFAFYDGKLNLRGRNGAGKSKVLSLTMPFLFDGFLMPSRMEPDADPGKKMLWNLLQGSIDRRIGYVWMEFGRLRDGDEPEYVTLGAGLSADSRRPNVDHWFFMIDAGVAGRVNDDLSLIGNGNRALTKDGLREVLAYRGRVFDTTQSYRDAVDERLFGVGTTRYDALMNTLIQLRQPQLSKRPDEQLLSNALTQSLTPLPANLVNDVSEALVLLDEHHDELEKFNELRRSVAKFERHYRTYAGMQTRRKGRLLRQAHVDFQTASSTRHAATDRVSAAIAAQARVEIELTTTNSEKERQQTRVNVLRDDPANKDSYRMAMAAEDAAERRKAKDEAATELDERRRKLDASHTVAGERKDHFDKMGHQIADIRHDVTRIAGLAGVSRAIANNRLISSEATDLVGADDAAILAAKTALFAETGVRRSQISEMRRMHGVVNTAQNKFEMFRDLRHDKESAKKAAEERLSQADNELDAASDDLLDAWQRHFVGLRRIKVDVDGNMERLAEWIQRLEEKNPCLTALLSGQQEAVEQIAKEEAEIKLKWLANERLAADLQGEREKLVAGVDIPPPPQYTRDYEARSGRPGAPFWKLVDFKPKVRPEQRAGIEAALEGSGLLDAWVSPNGAITDAEGKVLPLDANWSQRSSVAQSPLKTLLAPSIPPECDVPTAVVERLLAGIACSDNDPGGEAWLSPSGRYRLASLAGAWTKPAPPECDVPTAVVERLLAGIACSDNDPGGEAWLSPSGRYRLASLAGAWTKPAPAYIGTAARAQARAARLSLIDEAEKELGAERTSLREQINTAVQEQEQVRKELEDIPSDVGLRRAHLAVKSATESLNSAKAEFSRADTDCQEAERRLQQAVNRRLEAATDMGLPVEPSGLTAVEDSLTELDPKFHGLDHLVYGIRQAWRDYETASRHEDDCRQEFAKQEAILAQCQIDDTRAEAQLAVLRETIGMRVDQYEELITAARHALSIATDAYNAANAKQVAAAKEEGAANEALTSAETQVKEAADNRFRAIDAFKQVAEAGLIPAALPAIDIPDLTRPWAVDAALGLARKAEQELSNLEDTDEAWRRSQSVINTEFRELDHALNALGHEAHGTQSDSGISVRIVFQGKEEQPHALLILLDEEIVRRENLLSVREQEILEQHLKQDIAIEIHRLLRTAEKQVHEINRELDKYPTATGVKFKLQWEPTKDNAGSTANFERLRTILLQKSAELLTEDERKEIGDWFLQRIKAENENPDSYGQKSADRLARALDYRLWHRFRVQRSQNGGWKSISDPASSGERALGLTVPMIAAVANFYNQSAGQLAPRLILLDEAFAGIDDHARGDCAKLIQMFDLDFMITSEREWACYPAFPGVSICELQRAPGVDAVFVSRWKWDGKQRRQVTGRSNPTTLQ
ncbi:TIGR02680 family protein [Cupriavidus taiwanensis]|uniref:TIGR02680 family protein n=1 Tax=Cupriavidus taiwanensis TaxID=164546 RepID=UPI003F49B1C9